MLISNPVPNLIVKLVGFVCQRRAEIYFVVHSEATLKTFMVRKYSQKVESRKYRDYTEEDLEIAIVRYRNRETLPHDGEEFNIPYRKLKGLHLYPAGCQAVSATIK